MIKNEERTGVIEKLGYNGEGILHDGEYTVFIPFALSGEKVRYKVLKVKGNVAFGKVIEIITPSVFRERPKCEVYTKCGGCQLQHLAYKEQLKLKADIVRDCLSKIAFIDFDADFCEKSDEEWGYRNKLQLPVRATDGGVAIGFFAPNSHRVIPISDCPIQPAWCKEIIAATKEYVGKCGVSAYSDETKRGLLREVVVRAVGGSLLITLVINGEALPRRDELIEILKSHFDEFSLYVNINKTSGNAVFGEKFICLFGKSKYSVGEFGIRYGIGPASFMQVNDGMRAKLYKEAIEAAGADKNTVVIDAYSGAGLLTALFALRSKKAIGIEIVKEAVDCADELKRENGIDNMENICAPCEDVLPSVIEREEGKGNRVVLVLDPPRSGADAKVIEAIKKHPPESVIYISCSPQTLARDLGLLTGTLAYDNGILKKANVDGGSGIYVLKSVKAFDLFPQTRHVETVVTMSRQ
ncbi:MAG: 23S rRNA (uracil(1939)-C(5))-methyltransferase RlmD [Clostridia bacterium]|nr:23S rRNA (uracil(1939)-C(5))-methyltransferase RlmD [Clostridia bacterium]